MVKRRVKFDITAQDKTAAAFAAVKGRLDGINRAVSVTKGLFGAAFVVAGVRALKDFTEQAIKAGDAIAKTSRNLGLTGEELQALRHGAELAGTGVATLESSMTAFVKRVGEAKAGMGPLVSGLKTLDSELLANIKSSKSQREALGFVAQAMQSATTAADRARIANAAFSRAGIPMIEMLRNGRDGLAAFKAEAEDLEIILGSKLTLKAEELNDELGRLDTQISVNLTRAFINLGDEIVATKTLYAEFLAILLRGISPSTADQLGDVARQIDVLNKMIKETENDFIPDFLQASSLGLMKSKLIDLTAEYNLLADQIRDANENAAAPAAPTVPPDGTRAGSGPADTGKPYDAHIKAQERYLKGLKIEGQRLADNATAISRYNARIERLKELLENNAISQQVYRIEVEKAKDAMERQGDQAEKTAETIATGYEDSFKTASDALERFVSDGEYNLKSLGRLAINIFGDILRQKQSVSGGGFDITNGGIGGVFGRLLGREHGGPVTAGQSYIVGEKRAEIFTPDRNGTILPSVPTGGTTITYNIDARGAERGVGTEILMALQRQVAGMNRDLEPRAIAAVAFDRQNGGATAQPLGG